MKKAEINSKIVSIVNGIDEIPQKHKALFCDRVFRHATRRYQVPCELPLQAHNLYPENTYLSLLSRDDEDIKKAFSLIYREEISRWMDDEKRRLIVARTKKCIVLTCEEYETILKEIFGEDLIVDYSYDGIETSYNDSDGQWEGPDDTEIYERLSDYFFGLKVTSVHIDNYTPAGVWVCYR